MKLSEAKNKIDDIIGIPFKELLSEDQINEMFIINKGKTGQLLERIIGLNLSNTTLDFEDGELKTNKCNRNGNPMETMFITQIASMIDELLNENPFKDTKLYEKLKHLLYVPIFKEGPATEWMFLQCIEIDLTLPKYAKLEAQLEADYYHICALMNQQLSSASNAMLHTVNGNFIQIRTKDSKPYHPIISQKYNRKVSDKNRAFYFKKEFMKYITSLEK